MKIKKKKKKEKKGKDTPKKEGDERRQPVDWWRQKSRRSASLFAAASRRRWRQAARLTAGYSLTVNSLTFISFFYFFVSLSLSLALYSFFFWRLYFGTCRNVFWFVTVARWAKKEKRSPLVGWFRWFFFKHYVTVTPFSELDWYRVFFFLPGFAWFRRGSTFGRHTFFCNFQFFFPFFLSSRENRWQAAHR